MYYYFRSRPRQTIIRMVLSAQFQMAVYMDPLSSVGHLNAALGSLSVYVSILWNPMTDISFYIERVIREKTDAAHDEDDERNRTR